MVLFDTAYWRGLFDWITGTVLEEGNISQLDPSLMQITDDVEQAVDVAVSGIAR